MARLFLSGIATRQQHNEPQTVQPKSVLSLFGRKTVKGCWSGLYGTSSTREGIKRLLQSADQPQSIFRVICEVPGEVVTRMGAEDLRELGYLNVRYADASLYEAIEKCWAKAARMKDGQKAIETHPEYAQKVAHAIAPGNLSLIIHPVKVPGSELVLSVGTILNTVCIDEIHSRDRNLNIQLVKLTGN